MFEEAAIARKDSSVSHSKSDSSAGHDRRDSHPRSVGSR